MIRRSLAFLCDSGGRLQKSGNVDCDPLIRFAASLKGVIKRMSRCIGHLLPVGCGERRIRLGEVHVIAIAALQASLGFQAIYLRQPY